MVLSADGDIASNGLSPAGTMHRERSWSFWSARGGDRVEPLSAAVAAVGCWSWAIGLLRTDAHEIWWDMMHHSARKWNSSKLFLRHLLFHPCLGVYLFHFRKQPTWTQVLTHCNFIGMSWVMSQLNHGRPIPIEADLAPGFEWSHHSCGKNCTVWSHPTWKWVDPPFAIHLAVGQN